MPILVSVAVLIWLALLLALGVSLFVITYLADKSAAPFFPTPKSVIRRALTTVSLKKGEVFYDLGAGTGRTLFIAEREFGALACGFEISFIFYFLAKINLLLHRSHAGLKLQNFFTADLGGADIIFCFLTPHGMEKFANKFYGRLKPGARVVSYAFPIKSMQPQKIIDIDEHWKMFVYVYGASRESMV